jgi:hypothetical protein
MLAVSNMGYGLPVKAGHEKGVFLWFIGTLVDCFAICSACSAQ